MLSRASLSEGLPVAAKRALATNEAYASEKAIDDLASYARAQDPQKAIQFVRDLPLDIRKAVAGKLALKVDEVNNILGTAYKDIDAFIAAKAPRNQGYKALTSLGDDAQRGVRSTLLNENTRNPTEIIRNQ